MLQYGSCPRGCGAQVAYDSGHPDVALDATVPFSYSNTSGQQPVPHLCALGPAPTDADDARTLANAIADDLKEPTHKVRMEPRTFLTSAVEQARDQFNGTVRKAMRDVIAGRIAPRLDAPIVSKIPPDVTNKAREQLLEEACKMIVRAIGDDLSRPGLADTPQRFARMMLEFFGGSDGDNAAVDEPRVFEHDTVDQLVIVDRLDVWSMCEHHVLPFSMSVDVGYIARGRVLGLSKFGRIARRLAARLTMQERYVEALADAIVKATGSNDVIVVARGEHLCMMMRGARMAHRASSAALRGAFKDDAPARAEFYSLVTRR